MRVLRLQVCHIAICHIHVLTVIFSNLFSGSLSPFYVVVPEIKTLIDSLTVTTNALWVLLDKNAVNNYARTDFPLPTFNIHFVERSLGHEAARAYLFIIMRPSSLGGGRILRRTLSVGLSVCPSVRPSRYRASPSVTWLHLANYNDTHVLLGTRRGPHIVRPSRPHKLVIIIIIIIISCVNAIEYVNDLTSVLCANPPAHVTSHPGQLSLSSFLGR